jgi:DNA repair protein RecO (recombination protein O)
MEQLKTLSFVTRSMNWRETSKIVTLFTREEGRIDVIAKGARKKNNLYQGVIETLNLVEVLIFHSPRRELQLLGNVTLEDSFHGIRSDLEKTAYAFSVVELVNTFFIQADSEPVFFDFLHYIIKFIEKNDKNEIAFWYFILKLTSFLGFRPQWNRCHQCGNTDIKENKYFSFRDGAVVCRKCKNEIIEKQPIEMTLMKYLEQLQKVHYKKLDQVEMPDNKYHNYTNFLLEYLRYHTDQKLNLHGLSLLGNSLYK